MFRNKFIVVSDTESNPLRQYKFKVQVWCTYKEMVLINFGKNLVMQNFFLVVYKLAHFGSGELIRENHVRTP